MHTIRIPSNSLRTDLITEQTNPSSKKKIKTVQGLKVEEIQQEKKQYTTIFFEDITDQENFTNVQNVFIKELKKYIKREPEDKYLVIGLGNKESTPDSLGPNTINSILVTRHLFLLNAIEDGYSNVAAFSPNVMGNTGIETSDIMKSIIEKTNVNKVIIIDALKTNHLNRLGKTIQITDYGISPGSGIGNIRKELSKEILKVEVIAIGIPTVVDLHCLSSGKIGNDNFMVTPTNIDFLIEKLSLLVGNAINIFLHKNFIRQNRT